MMGNHLVIVGENFALCNELNQVIGVVCKCNDTQYQFIPLVKGGYHGVLNYINLRSALETALSFKAKS